MTAANPPQSFWVKLEDGPVDKVKTVGCDDIADFAKAIKRTFANRLAKVDAVDLQIYLKETGGETLVRDYSLDLIPKNDARHPLLVKFPSPSSNPPPG